MLCFLPPVPAVPENDPPTAPAPRASGTAAAVLVVLVAVSAVLMPVAWPHRPRPPAAGPTAAVLPVRLDAAAGPSSTKPAAAPASDPTAREGAR